jgi:hypothetical protein
MPRHSPDASCHLTALRWALQSVDQAGNQPAIGEASSNRGLSAIHNHHNDDGDLRHDQD